MSHPPPIAVVLPNWIGDVAMATPALRALKEHDPQRPLIGVMRPYVVDVLAGTPWLDEVILHRRKSKHAMLRSPAVAQQLRDRGVGCMLLMPNSFSTAWLAWMTGAGQRIGFARYGRRWLLTHPLHAPRQGRKWTPRSAVDHYLQLLTPLGIQRADRHLQLATRVEDEYAADDVWSALGLDRETPVVSVNTGAAYGPAKSWPAHHYADLARRIVRQHAVQVLFLCGPAEREHVAEIAQRAAHPRIHSLAPFQPGIGLTKACLRRSRLLVTTDSGPRHLAAAFGVPTVALFGPTDPRWSENGNPEEIQLQLRLECGPCACRVCPLGTHRCMRDLHPGHVMNWIDRQLQRKTTPAAA